MIDYKLICGLLASILSIFAFYPYVLNTIKGNIKPHPITWLTSSVVGLVTTIVMFYSGGGAMSLFWLTVFLPKPIIVFFSFKNGGKSDISKKDILKFILAILALIIWIFIKNVNLSSTLLVITSLIGVSSTIDKAHIKPWEEGLSMWTIQVCSSVLSILAIESYNYSTLSKTVINFLINITVALTIYFSRKNKIK